MTLNQSQSLKFSIKESVWFQRGQEISDILSVSLDPDISIQEHENYISIRGALQLNGEYYPREIEGTDSEVYSLRETSVRTIDQINESENGIYEMSHKFPIDITIPMNRVEKLDDVYVMVESFDYEIPKEGSLQLSAELSISGIVGERKQHAQSSENDNTASVAKEQEEPFVRTDIEPEVKPEEQNADIEREENQQVEDFPSFEIEAKKEIEEVLGEDIVDEDDLEEEEEMEEEEEEEEEEEREAVIEEVEEEEKMPTSPQIEMKSRIENIKPEDENQSDEQSALSKKDENALYLTNILSGQGTEEFSKMRMRIVQQGESLDTIANRYEVSLNKLLQMNGFEDSEVPEGEIVYIPVSQNE